MDIPSSRTIDVVSDVVCPWCWIGKRQLEAALESLPAAERPVVRWHAFQLNPDLPPGGIDRREYLERKFGGAERAAQIYARVREAGRTVGLALDFDRIERQPNTLDAHRLIAWAQERGDADPLVEALFRAYFVEGRYTGDPAVLAAIAGEAGFDAAAARAMLDGDDLREEIAESDRRMRESGIGGVPFFVFDRRLAVSGAQGTAALKDALAQSAPPA
ncbi:MAG TPA: DsbA family oxidoreductase [Burkholderiaceae bacterium]|nr:DsbA family oxidoreductase [Burkholderiaceae bacterium]